MSWNRNRILYILGNSDAFLQHDITKTSKFYSSEPNEDIEDVLNDIVK